MFERWKYQSRAGWVYAVHRPGSPRLRQALSASEDDSIWDRLVYSYDDSNPEGVPQYGSDPENPPERAGRGSDDASGESSAYL